MSPSTPHLTSAEPQPLRSALKHDGDDDGKKPPDLTTVSNTKAVHIAEPEPDPEENLPKRQFSAGVAKRLSGRSHMSAGASSSRLSLLSQASLEALNDLSRVISPEVVQEDSAQSQSPHRHRIDRMGERIIAQVAEWLDHERTKRQNRKARRAHGSRRKHHKDDAQESDPPSTARLRSFSVDSQSSEVSLDRLQKIIDDSMSSLGLHAIPHHSPRLGRKSQRRRSVALHRTASSDTEFYDGDVIVPSCDGVLDNSKTLSYTGGNAVSEEASSVSKRKEKERRAWSVFKSEIIRLTHTLRLKGWRGVPLDSGDAISVERLSGALTNAVYVVTPPEGMTSRAEGGKKNPAKLLLRVYGPQVEHIIDRENELSVLRRLARKKIGPRLLGTFANGRFEQYLNAVTLTAEDLRDPDTSKQIAKRMRELHDGMELLEDEKDSGPAVLKNWDNWVSRVSQAVSFLDAKIREENPESAGNTSGSWKERGFVCGTDWPTFKAMVDKYREYLFDRYGGSKAVREQLVFCHNDTQYGNILRVRPDDTKSPLLQPNYEHKQLVVIDFEYAAANVRGYEFANHFTEWCYDYHDDTRPFACQPNRYPTPEEQYRLIKSYVNHRPEHPYLGASTPSLTPLATPTMGPSVPQTVLPATGSTGSIVEFMLDARVPPGGWKEEEKRKEEQVEEQIQSMVEETRLWRPMCSAMWIAWGIMQAKIPGFEPEGEPAAAQGGQPDEEDEGDDHGFDYLRYTQDRAMFFWRDCVASGLVQLEDLPETVRNNINLSQH
ncbi:kinase-like domain-containing protein [Xylaria palmicola]|nr:kinase-like domain-containing protein [Xylaria palmicola]